MLMAMSYDQVELISGCKNSHEILVKLETMYVSTSGENKQALWQEFYSIMASEEKNPVQVMCEIQNLAAQLRSLGVSVDDKAVVARVVSSLMDDKYRQFREAWKSVEISQQSTALLLSRLKTWELDEKSSKSSSSSSSNIEKSKAFAAGGNPQQAKFKKDKTSIKCYNCGKKGHYKNKCRSPKQEKNGQAKNHDQKTEDTEFQQGYNVT
ncbi:unnamed protein product [Orchesella dallaii]|uniref:CCHC-type domain-containing protein n=1 Tax=Orchesella dallaii TaxID=48710 RepID=A0ABP1QR18_9HEXA